MEQKFFENFSLKEYFLFLEINKWEIWKTEKFSDRLIKKINRILKKFMKQKILKKTFKKIFFDNLISGKFAEICEFFETGIFFS